MVLWDDISDNGPTTLVGGALAAGIHRPPLDSEGAGRVRWTGLRSQHANNPPNGAGVRETDHHLHGQRMALMVSSKRAGGKGFCKKWQFA